MTQHLSDAELLQAYVDGDARAFGDLAGRHLDRLWAVAVRTLGDADEASDAVQDALVSALRAAPNFRGDSAVTTWLHRIVVNACLDRMRRRAVRPTVPLLIDVPSHSADGLSAVEARIDVALALGHLPEDQRLAIVLVDLQELPVSEAAVILGIPEGTVKSRCARGRMAMAAFLRANAAPAGNQGGAAPVQGQSAPTRRGWRLPRG